MGIYYNYYTMYMIDKNLIRKIARPNHKAQWENNIRNNNNRDNFKVSRRRGQCERSLKSNLLLHR